MDSYVRNGQEVYDKFCDATTPNSVMFPRAPQQTYVDIFPGPVQDQADSFKNDRRHQADYETEVVLYRALERMKIYLFVLHSFQFTHVQVCPIRNKTCPKCKNPHNQEGECDFLILAPNCCLIIEVKNMSHIEEGEEDREGKVRALVNTFRKSVIQRKKIETLIKGLDESLNQSTTVLQFTAYPNFSRTFKEQFQENSELCLSDDELSTVIFHEDILGQMEVSVAHNSSTSTDHVLTSQSSQDQLNVPGEPAGISHTSPFSTGDEVNREEDEMSRDEVNREEDELSRDEVNREEDELSRDEVNREEDEPSRKSVTSTQQDWEWDDKEAEMSVWWENNVSNKVSSVSKLTPEVRNILLAIWSTENNKFYLPKCSLGKCIKDIDEQLKKGKITLEPKSGRKRKRTENPGVVKAPHIVKNCTGVDHLTAEQHQAFSSSENFLLVNGPAGAGKSVVLCAQLIELAQGDKENKVVLFKPETIEEENNIGNNIYESALRKAGVQQELIKYDDNRTISQLHKLITDSMCNVFIVEFDYEADELTDMLSVLNNCHIFVDDIQYAIMNYTSDSVTDSKLIDRLLQISDMYKVRVACDLAQQFLFYTSRDVSDIASVISYKLSDNQIICLSRNLRNTRDISDILSVIRDMYIETQSNTSREIIDMILPTQLPGHFIHGPRTNFNILSSNNQINDVLNGELDKLLTNNSGLINSDICIVYNFNESLVKDIVTTRCSDITDNIAMCYSRHSYSAEWPAVVVLHTQWSNYSDVDNLGLLYLQLSRARVYCSVIIYPEYEEGYTEDKRLLLHLADKLSNVANFVRH